ncbi:MAG TPA: PAS domain-containing protein [Azospirillum sp.]|nr:PAS domain-containing protein [Azospirillum sp.]
MAHVTHDDVRPAGPPPVASADLLSVALDSADVGVWDVDLATGAVTQSDTVGPLFGLPRGAPHRTLQEWRACIHPEDREASRRAFGVAVGSGGRYQADYRVLWPDGSIHWLSSTGRVFLGEGGAPCRAVGILQDVTGRKRAEKELVQRTQELAESEAQYRTMGEAIPYGVWLCDADGGARYVSPSFLELLEMTQEEQAEFGWTERYDPATREDMLAKWMHCVRTGELWEYEHRILGPDNQYHTVLSRGRPVRDDRGTITSWVGVNLDITDRKRAENEVLRKNEELQRLLARIRELDEAKSTFFANVSHELRTPLALILGPVDKLLGQQLTPGQREELRVVRRNAATLLKQVNALLDLSKIDAGKMALHYARVDLSEVVRLVAGQFDGLARQRGIDYRIDVPDRLPAEIDAEKIERVLLNLLSNAFKFVSDGGRVFCSLRDEDGHARILVRDNGPGIPAEDRERIFQRFSQGNVTGYRRFGGSGLGLSIAHDFVDLHGGTIRVGEAPDAGAEFQVVVPLLAPGDAAVLETGRTLSTSGWIAEELSDEDDGGGEPAGSAPAETPAPMGGAEGRPTVLVVEDNGDLRRHLVAGLADRWRVIAATDGEDGLEQARAVRPDVIVTDLMMPCMSGGDMILALRGDAALAAVPIIVLSARADDAMRVRLLSGSVQDYLIKPFAAEELRARVANLIEMKRARDILQSALDSAHNVHRLATLGQFQG